MAPPVNFVLFWRDSTTPKSNPLYDTIEELIAAKPLQCIVFNDNTTILASIKETEQNNTSNDPALTPTASLLVVKQYNGTFGTAVQLKIVSDVSETAFRKKIRTFTRLAQIEPSLHEFGIFGIFHPLVTDFNVDPTADFGYTLDTPTHEYISGSQAVVTTLNLTIGGRLNLIP